jgi:hypothetical protein
VEAGTAAFLPAGRPWLGQVRRHPAVRQSAGDAEATELAEAPAGAGAEAAVGQPGPPGEHELGGPEPHLAMVNR